MLFGAEMLALSLARDATLLELSALRAAAGLVLAAPRELDAADVCALFYVLAPSALFAGGAVLFCGALLPFTFASM